MSLQSKIQKEKTSKSSDKMKIDAENLIVGRMATVAAKHALQGEQVEIINCDKAVISGNSAWLKDEWTRKRHQGTHRSGPYYDKRPERFVKRIIRGMLPHRQAKGEAALKRITCHVSAPEGSSGHKTIEEANFKKLKSARFMYIKDIVKTMGGK